MKCDQVEHYDDFDDAIIFWVDVDDPPAEIQDEAKQIDGEDYSPDCFGVCAIYDKEQKEFDLVVDTELGDKRNAYYIDINGEKHWFDVDLEPDFVEQVFAECAKTEVMIPILNSLGSPQANEESEMGSSNQELSIGGINL